MSENGAAPASEVEERHPADSLNDGSALKFVFYVPALLLHAFIGTYILYPFVSFALRILQVPRFLFGWSVWFDLTTYFLFCFAAGMVWSPFLNRWLFRTSWFVWIPATGWLAFSFIGWWQGFGFGVAVHTALSGWKFWSVTMPALCGSSYSFGAWIRRAIADEVPLPEKTSWQKSAPAVKSVLTTYWNKARGRELWESVEENDMTFNLQPTLSGPTLELRPLRADDFEALFAAASDPLIWEQHPDNLRYRRDVFQKNYFETALDSRGAFVILDRATREIIGSSRYWNYKPEESEIEVGWTFLTRQYWGGATNLELKRLMIGHALNYVERVVLVVGEHNLRSQKACEKIGAHRERMEPRPDGKGQNVVFAITRADLPKLEARHHADASH